MGATVELQAMVLNSAALMNDAEAQVEMVARGELAATKWKQRVPRVASASAKNNSQMVTFVVETQPRVGHRVAVVCASNERLLVQVNWDSGAASCPREGVMEVAAESVVGPRELVEEVVFVLFAPVHDLAEIAHPFVLVIDPFDDYQGQFGWKNDKKGLTWAV